MTFDVDEAHAAAIREDVARRTVACLNCGGRLLWLPIRRRYGHVRGDRIQVSGRCFPDAAGSARPAVDPSGQTRLDVEVPT